MLEGASRLVAIWVCAVALFTGCGGTNNVTPCPSYLVVPDAGVSGFSSVGEWRADSVCAQYCDNTHPTCQLVSPTSVKCQAGCG
jgi:hypothetical protein